MKAKILFAFASVAMAIPSSAHEIFYAGTLSGLQEVPANASPATGTAFITIDLDLVTMRVQTNFSGLTGNTTASHIHIGNGPGTNGGVATTTPTFTGFPVGVKNGSYDHTFDLAAASSYNPSFITANGNTVGGAFNAFLNGLAAGKGYLNIHTQTFGGGEIRANLVAVPEPGTIAALGLAVAPLLLRRRKA